MAEESKQITSGVRPLPPLQPLPVLALTNYQTLVWTEIPCLDLERIQTFYSTVFGWTSKPTCNPDVSIFSKENTSGSFVKLTTENFLSPAIHPDNPSKERLSVRVTINVESIDEALKEVEKAGGALYM
jgi:predicted enzyme related to lactoylglutathione lyase